MFSGQGSQYFSMGRDLYDTDPAFREAMSQCDRHLKVLLGESLLSVIYPESGPRISVEFDNILHTHPALFCVQYSLAQALLQRNLRPDLLLGYSLGEFVAAAIGGALPVETILGILVHQAKLLNRSAEPGAMLAILDSPEIWNPDDPLFANTWIAARNFSNHFVLSGTRSAIGSVQKYFQGKEITTQLLAVKYAFHSPSMDIIEEPFKRAIREVKSGPLSIPLISASQTSVITSLASDFFWDVVRRPVQFDQTIALLEDQGSCNYVDLGPTGTLATFLKYTLDRASLSKIFPTMTPFNRTNDNLLRLQNSIAPGKAL
jgi:acyl transferase domain-containing protein